MCVLTCPYHVPGSLHNRVTVAIILLLPPPPPAPPAGLQRSLPAAKAAKLGGNGGLSGLAALIQASVYVLGMAVRDGTGGCSHPCWLEHGLLGRPSTSAAREG